MSRDQIQKVIGIDIGSSSIKAVALGIEGGQLSCLGIKVNKFQHGIEITDGILAENLKEIIGSFKNITQNVVLIASDREIQLRFLTKPAMDRNTLDMVMKNEMKVGDSEGEEKSATAKFYSVVGEQENENAREYHILSLSCPFAYLRKHEALVKKAGGTLIGMYPSSVAIRECMMTNYEDEISGQPLPHLIALLNFGADQNQITVCDGGVLKLARSFPLAGEDLTKALIGSYKTPDGVFEFDRNMAEDYKTAIGILSHQEAMSYSDGAVEVKISQMIERNFERMTQKMRLSLDYFKGQMKVQVARALIYGGGANMHGIIEKLKDALMVEHIAEFLPLNKIRYAPVEAAEDPSPDVLSALPFAVGCAICAFREDQSLNLVSAIKRDYSKIVRKVLLTAVPFVFAFFAALVLPAFYGWQVVYPEKFEAVELREKYAVLSDEFSKVEAYKKQHDQLVKTKIDWKIRSAFIKKVINGRMFWSDLLIKLEAILPAEIWITQMSAGDMANAGTQNNSYSQSNGEEQVKAKPSSSKVAIKGRSYSHQAISQFVKALETSKLFRNIKWEGNVKDSEKKLEEIQFSLTFTVSKSVLRKERNAGL
ncbi:MAG: PilN domain-containing protein [Candidatus Riflebacteria bacterium]|nr:PilN domain-containing protein [Candidatus Riflebacteria bacterium]